MDSLRVAGLKGTMEILECLEKGEGTWSGIQKECTMISHRIFNTRLKQLENQGFITSRAEMISKKATKIYSLTKKGKMMLELMGQIEKI